MSERAQYELTYSDFRELRRELGPRLSYEGLWIDTEDPEPEGTPVGFEVRLRSDFVLLRGSGTVVDDGIRDVDAEPWRRYAGMFVRFSDLDDPTRRLVEAFVDRHQREGGESLPVPETQSARAEKLATDLLQTEARSVVLEQATTKFEPRPSEDAPKVDLETLFEDGLGAPGDPEEGDPEEEEETRDGGDEGEDGAALPTLDDPGMVVEEVAADEVSLEPSIQDFVDTEEGAAAADEEPESVVPVETFEVDEPDVDEPEPGESESDGTGPYRPLAADPVMPSPVPMPPQEDLLVDAVEDAGSSKSRRGFLFVLVALLAAALGAATYFGWDGVVERLSSWSGKSVEVAQAPPGTGEGAAGSIAAESTETVEPSTGEDGAGQPEAGDPRSSVTEAEPSQVGEAAGEEAPVRDASAPAPAPAPTAATAPVGDLAAVTPPPTPAPRPAPGVQPSVTQLETRVLGGTTELRVTLSAPIGSEAISLSRVTTPPPRQLLVLRGVSRGRAPLARRVGTRDVAQVRSGYHAETSPPALHIVADLASDDVVVSGPVVSGNTVTVRFARPPAPR